MFEVEAVYKNGFVYFYYNRYDTIHFSALSAKHNYEYNSQWTLASKHL